MVNKWFADVVIEGDLSLINEILEDKAYQIMQLSYVSIATKTILNEDTENEYGLMVTAGCGESFEIVSKKDNAQYQLTFDELNTPDSFEFVDRKSILDSGDGPIYLRVNLNDAKKNLSDAISYIESNFSQYEGGL